MRTAAGVELLFNLDTQKFESSNWEAVNAALEADLHNAKDPIGVINATDMKRFIKLYGIANPS